MEERVALLTFSHRNDTYYSDWQQLVTIDGRNPTGLRRFRYFARVVYEQKLQKRYTLIAWLHARRIIKASFPRPYAISCCVGM